MTDWIWLDDSKYPEFSKNTRENPFDINKDGFCMAEFLREFAIHGKAKLKICADARY